MIQKKHLYYLKTVLESGKSAWFIVAANDNIKLELLKKRIADNDPYDIKDYARVLRAGFAPEAPQEVLDHINSEHGTSFSN